MKIFLLFVGKPRSAAANALAEEYMRRASRFSRCEMREVNPRRWDPFSAHPSAQRVLCDPEGRLMDSSVFARLVGTSMERAQDLVFVLGGHDGLPAEWKSRAEFLLSLSPLTLPHELARVVLAEQIYRALAALRGHPYPR